MTKLQQLTAFLINLNLVAAEQIDGWVENPQIIPSGKSMGEGILLYRQEYDAVISIERFPHKNLPAELLFGQVCAWLMENDGERDEIAKPRTDVDILDAETADIEISISFEEDVYATPDPAGTIVLNGVNYRLADALIDYAETGDVRT
jgi:hypothetical protein